MIPAMTTEVAAVFRSLCKGPMPVPRAAGSNQVLDRVAVQAILPHRDPLLLIDEVTWLDVERRLIAARYDLRRAANVLAGHFPGIPLWPGVFQVEAIGQAGSVLAHATSLPAQEAAPRYIVLTQILGARFMRPIPPGGSVEIAARLIDDGLFAVIVGQCLHNESVCSVAAIRGLASNQTDYRRLG